MTTANQRNTGGSRTIIPASTRTLRSSSWIEPERRASSMSPSATSSELIALALVQRFSAGVRPKRSRESRMKPVDGVMMASARRMEARTERSKKRIAIPVVATSVTSQMARCCVRIRASGRNSSRSTSRPANRNRATMPRLESRARVLSWLRKPKAPARIPSARLVIAAGNRNRWRNRGTRKRTKSRTT